VIGRWRSCAGLALILTGATAQAQPITADRPGVGSDPDVVPPFTLQPEIGTDTREVRLGLLPGVEVDRDDDSWGAKLALVDHTSFKLSVKGTIDDSGQGGFELPASLVVNSLFYVTTDVIWTRAAQTYAAEFNLTPTPRLTISPTFYVDTRPRGAVFAAWVPRGHDNLQFDIGYDRRRLSVGISTAFDLTRLRH
jgi:hypothetical protein